MDETNLKQKWIIDTDPGVDDMMAISYLLNHPEAEILMLCTTDGNVCIDKVTNNLKKILKLTQKKVPIYRGSLNPLLKVFPNEESYHYADGLGDIEEIKKYQADEIKIEKESSIVKIVECILSNPNEINLLCIGPLTNIAAAYMLCPSIANLVKNVYMMGGSFLALGNLNSPGEFNFAYDYISTKIVLSNFKNIVLTPWEPTAEIYFKSHNLQEISKSIANKNLKLNHQLHNFCSLIVEKYTSSIRNGTQFCDYYSILTCLHKKCVKKYSVCKVDIITDSIEMVGMLLIKKRREMVKDFEFFMKNEFITLESDDHVIIEELHGEECISEYEKVFYLNH